jgi:hypothetical protein
VVENGNYYTEGASYFSEEDKGIHNPKAIYHDIKASIKEYIEIQFETKLNYDSNDESIHFEYAGLPICNTEIRDEYIKKHNIINDNLTEEDYDLLAEPFNTLMPKLLILHQFIYYNNKILELKHIKIIKIGIIASYLFCWLYVLVVSVYLH